MKKAILTIGLISGLALAAPLHAETTITQNPDGSTTTTMSSSNSTTTTYYTRSSDNDPRVAAIKTPAEFNTYAYSRWDKNGDGMIEPDEWDSNVTKWYGPNTTVYKTYTYWDKNHNGKLDPSEFDTAAAETNLYKTWDTTTTVVPTAQATDASFASYDLNGDGKITPSEWEQTHK